ncbi:MAG: hypothetical protein ACREDY_01755, partial [Bradyrhizobium sp.]
MQDALEAQCAAYAGELEAAGIKLADPARDPSARGPWPFLLRAERLTDALPDCAGALTFLIEPERVDDAAGFARSIVFLADQVRSRWLKFIVIDERLSPRLGGPAADHPNIGRQIFWCSPDEIERRLDAALARPQPASAAEARRTLAMA